MTHSGSAAQSSASPHHLGALTGIRGFAAWLVVLYHIRLSLEALLPDWLIVIFSKGYLAVDLFFMLSGFVMWYNYADRLRERSLAATGDFLWRRIARIWPLHVFILTLFMLLVAALGIIGRSLDTYPVGELPLHILLFQNWGWTSDLRWNHPAWSISTELAAYLLFPCVASIVRWDKLPALSLTAIAAALLIAIHLLFALNGHADLGQEIPRLGLWRCLLEFALGNVVCIIWQRWRSSTTILIAARTICISAFAAGFVTALPETALVPLAFASGLLALACDTSWLAKTLGAAPLRYLGEISYSTYLSHFLLFILFKLLFVDASKQLTWPMLAGFLGLVLVSSIMLYHGVEKPSQRWLNRHKPFISRHTSSLYTE